MTNKITNKMPDREPDFYIPIYKNITNYWINCWKIDNKENFDLVFRIELKDGSEVIYAERIFIAPDKFKNEFFRLRIGEVQSKFLRAIVEQYVVKLEEPKDYKEKLLN